MPSGVSVPPCSLSRPHPVPSPASLAQAWDWAWPCSSLPALPWPARAASLTHCPEEWGCRYLPQTVPSPAHLLSPTSLGLWDLMSAGQEEGNS